jgi:hypothetical protein
MDWAGAKLANSVITTRAVNAERQKVFITTSSLVRLRKAHYSGLAEFPKFPGECIAVSSGYQISLLVQMQSTFATAELGCLWTVVTE